MARDIKFRAWDGEKYHYQDDQYLTSFLRRFIESINIYNGIASGHESYLSKRLDEYLEQHAGLKDKNGTEIYEGDVVEVKSLCLFGEDLNCRGVVDFLECGFVITDRKTFSNPLFVENCDIEIIGNIYENPELI